MTITGSDLLAAHAAALTSGFGSSAVVIGSVRLRGLLDDEDATEVDASGYPVPVRRRVLTVATALLSALPANDSTITIDGTSYTTRQAERQGDGLHTRIVVVPTSG